MKRSCCPDPRRARLYCRKAACIFEPLRPEIMHFKMYIAIAQSVRWWRGGTSSFLVVSNATGSQESPAKGASKTLEVGDAAKRCLFDNDDDESCVEPDVKPLQQADQYLTDLEKVAKYLSKLRLLPCMRGTKVGVQARFASDACRKMAPGFSAQLRSRLKLVGYARALAPDEITSLSKGEMQECTFALAERVPMFPVSVLKALWELEAQAEKITGHAGSDARCKI